MKNAIIIIGACGILLSCQYIFDWSNKSELIDYINNFFAINRNIIQNIVIGIILYIFWMMSQYFFESDVYEESGIVDRLHDSAIVNYANNYLDNNRHVLRIITIITTAMLDVNILYLLYRIFDGDTKLLIMMSIMFGTEYIKFIIFGTKYVKSEYMLLRIYVIFTKNNYFSDIYIKTCYTYDYSFIDKAYWNENPMTIVIMMSLSLHYILFISRLL